MKDCEVKVQVLAKRRGRAAQSLRNVAPELNRWALMLAGICISLCALPALAANGQQGVAQAAPRPIVIPNRTLDNHDLNALAEKNAKKRNFDAANAERKRVIEDEASRLLILARDLKAKTDNLGNSPLTPTMAREAEVIQLLANDVKEKMKLTVSFD